MKTISVWDIRLLYKVVYFLFPFHEVVHRLQDAVLGTDRQQERTHLLIPRFPLAQSYLKEINDWEGKCEDRLTPAWL